MIRVANRWQIVESLFEYGTNESVKLLINEVPADEEFVGRYALVLETGI